MHILIAALHQPSKPTGVCRHAANLAQCLAEMPQVSKVSLIVGVWQQHYFTAAFQLSSTKINLVAVDIKNSSLSRNVWFMSGLPKLSNHLCPDIVHLAFPLPFLRQQFNAPVVATIHDLYPYECPENFGYPKVLFNRWFLKQCVHQSRALSCVSKTTLEQLKLYFPNVEQDKWVTVIYNIVDFNHSQSQIPKGWQADVPFLLCVAQHRKNKNLDLLIQSYDQLLQQQQLRDDTQLIIVGSPGPETGHLQQKVQALQLERRVHLLSSIGDNELVWLYQHCQAFILPSSTEGFCLPLVEAVSLSCQVVCSDIGIFRELGFLNCIYFDLQHRPAENLAKAIAQATQFPCGNQRFKQQVTDRRFSKTTAAKNYIHLYSKLLQPDF